MTSNLAHARRRSRSRESDEPALERTARVLGGYGMFRRQIATQLDAHDLITAGIPRGALTYVLAHGTELGQNDIANAVGMSRRTMQRATARPKGRLTREQSGRAWKFAAVLAKATEVFGGRDEAERWLLQPAMALSQRRPIDLLTTVAGTEVVEQLLGRLEHGVYT